jgi:hypothetical protein
MYVDWIQLLENLIVSKLITKFSAFYGIHFITMLVRDMKLSWRLNVMKPGYQPCGTDWCPKYHMTRGTNYEALHPPGISCVLGSNILTN